MRRRFSERAGLIEPRNAIQRGSIDERLASRLWTVIDLCFLREMKDWLEDGGATGLFWFHLFDDFLGEPFDSADNFIKINNAMLKKVFFESDWAIKYDLIDFLGDLASFQGGGHPESSLRQQAEMFIEATNGVLEQEKSAYRFVAGQITEITGSVEIEALETAVANTSKFAGSEQHLSSALKLFSDRQTPDYRNSIKESISAVESGFTAINGEKSKSLPDAMKKAEKNGFEMHPALTKGVSNIYGWTSDEGGVRHALVDATSNVGEPEARLMLVLCASFLNFLKQTAG